MTVQDGRRIPDGTLLEAEVCVVGTGAAGMTIVLELARRGIGVVVLEAGGRNVERISEDATRGAVAPGTVHDPLEVVRQRRLGGTTTQWGGRCAPLDELDFERRAWVTNSGWPFERNHLDPFYRRAHAYLRLGAWEYRAETALPVNEPFVDAASAVVDDGSIWRWSPPIDFWRTYGDSVRRSRTARLVHHSTVVRLERDGDTGTIVEAVVGATPEARFRVRAHVFILAVGGLETARLLLASNAQSPRGIGNEHDLVGRYYMTHPVAEIGQIRFADPRRAAAGAFKETRDGVYCRRMLKLRAHAQREHAVLNLAAQLWYPDPLDPRHGNALLSSYALIRNAMARRAVDWKSRGVHRRYGGDIDTRAHLRNVLSDMPTVVKYGGTWVRRRWLGSRRLPSFNVEPADGRLRFRIDAEQSPEPDNRVTLGRDRDAFGVSRLFMTYRVSPGDRASIARSLRAIASNAETGGVAESTIPDGHEPFEALALGDGTHQMGVTRMATSPRKGVVDERCRVHGAKNLYIASAAVFPTGGAVGPTLTVVALAIRVADDVARDRNTHAATVPSTNRRG